MRRASVAVILVGRGSSATILHAVRDETTVAFLEERIDQLAFHHFTLRPVDGAVDAIVRVADPDDRTSLRAEPSHRPTPASIDDAIRSAIELGPGATRIDAYQAAGAPARRMSVVVGPEATFVVRSGMDAAPAPSDVEVVDAAGLRAVVRSLVTALTADLDAWPR